MTSWASHAPALEPRPDALPNTPGTPSGLGSSAAESEPRAGIEAGSGPAVWTNGASPSGPSGLAALPVRRPGDVFGQAGWESREWVSSRPASPTSRALPFVALLIVAALLTLLLVTFAAHGHATAGWTWDDLTAVVA